jgi:hypothetical protein
MNHRKEREHTHVSPEYQQETIRVQISAATMQLNKKIQPRMHQDYHQRTKRHRMCKETRIPMEYVKDEAQTENHEKDVPSRAHHQDQRDFQIGPDSIFKSVFGIYDPMSQQLSRKNCGNYIYDGGTSKNQR